MIKSVKHTYRLYERKNGFFYIHNNAMGEQRSLKTKDKDTAKELFKAENETRKRAALNLELGKVYMRAADPKLGERTWQRVMDAMAAQATESTQARYQRGLKSKPFDLTRNKRIV
jgi:hypothetical protein